MTTDQWAALVGFFLPALVAIINREEWKPWVKGAVALLASALVGTITALVAGSFTGASWIQAVGVVFAASQLAYHTWWKGTDIAGQIEKAINIISPQKDSQPALGGSPGSSNTGESEGK
jgi:ABC-type uncharacterized transport system permease subunit